MSPIDRWIKNELWDIRWNDIALAARFLARTEINDYVGPEPDFVYTTMITTLGALYEVAMRVIVMPTLTLEHRCDAAVIALVTAPILPRDSPSDVMLCTLLRSNVTNPMDAFGISVLVEMIARYSKNNRQVHACCIDALQASAGMVGFEIPHSKRVTRQKLIVLATQLRRACIERNREIAAEYQAILARVDEYI
jgi:hypothetical protein